MLSYRHGFHAGNHADVLKHLVLVGLLEKLCSKDKPFSCIDSHGGAGIYDLTDKYARHNEEYKTGIARLWDIPARDPLLRRYQQVVAAFNPGPHLQCYPGSPAIMRHYLRSDDRQHVLELHPAEHESLGQLFAHDRRVSLHCRDAFEGLIALAPPVPRRGLALIDPSYEAKADYQRVVAVMRKLHKCWPVGMLVLWYPLLARRRDDSVRLKHVLAAARLPALTFLELVVMPQQEDYGMYGSGVVLVNTPWQFREQVSHALEELLPMLGVDASIALSAPNDDHWADESGRPTISI
jgi:23S rRNA (adenine2030-N6)-methyltransferase